MKKAFDNVLDDIYHMIDSQIAQNMPKQILLSGGFSNSKYVVDKIKEQYPEIDVVHPHDISADR
jgi:stalled ribosome rescue protein Dom34